MKYLLRAVIFLWAPLRAEYGAAKAAFVEWANEEEEQDYSRARPLVAAAK